MTSQENSLNQDSPLLDHSPHSLPAVAYYDEAWFQREQRAIWARSWIHVGRVTDFPPQTLTRAAVAGDNLMIASDANGTLHAFHNTCRHRGSVLCVAEVEPFNGKLIRCPYHAWAYDIQGRLISTAFGTPTDDFDKREHGLFSVALKVWNGFVFVCLDDQPPSFEPDLGIGVLDNWPMDSLVVGHVFEKRLACNWKVFWENYNECLHCPGVHPTLSQRVPVYRQGIMSPNEVSLGSPKPDAIPALEEGVQTWTVNGALCGAEFPDLSSAERADAHTFVTLYPSLYIVAHVDYVRAVTVTAVGPEETILRAQWLFTPQTLAAPGFDLSNVTDFATQVMIEDGQVCELNQQGLRSSRFTQGRLMPQEFDVYGFQQWVLESLAQVEADADAKPKSTPSA
ncbi:MAG: ring-hydroxylating oxygenase subunit alpha [Geminicoccus sp.]|nr:ring-hydroxylating oxygenase subunit alpha [Geminicoccus sp.]